ncbi:MAG: phosphatase PAP2 family protein [Planctomycetota bacterium]
MAVRLRRLRMETARRLRAYRSFATTSDQRGASQDSNSRPSAIKSNAPRGFHPPLFAPLLLLFVATLVFRLTNLDLAVSRLFFAEGPVPWPWTDCEPWRTLYVAGCYPVLGLAALGMLPALVGGFHQALKRWQKPSLFLGLVLLVGPGLMVNTLLKPFWGRPRPCQIAEFGGDSPYVAVWSFQPHSDSFSFPCGHASIGFYLMAPAFLLARRYPRWAIAFFCLGFGGGGMMGLARIIQGRHFASDVLWSAAFVYFSGVALYYLMRLHQDAAPITLAQASDADAVLPLPTADDTEGKARRAA